MSSAVIEPEGRVHAVHIEGLALMKIVKHCHDALPSMVSGSLLGLASNNGILEITHAFPGLDQGKSNNNNNNNDDDADDEFQLEMMRMLREVNVDNNCVGWYQSQYLGAFTSPSNLLDNQFSFQTDLSPNAVVILYDPLQTAHGTFAIKAYRLTQQCLQLKQEEKNDFLTPADIFEEIPVHASNPLLVQAMLQDFTTTNTNNSNSNSNSNNNNSTMVDLQRLDLSTHPSLEKNLESLCGWVDELANEQQKFQLYTRHLARTSSSTTTTTTPTTIAAMTAKQQAWQDPEAPKRMESLLINHQIQSYCDQMEQYAGDGLSKLFLASGLHKKE
eukprot:Nitzschia sp. Nitz4//scaffold254_size28068//10493//11667//NITZ4_008150-RA/size28068-augustus-gene-0.32-mRNA-1//-1//CDS//3329544328//4078//frame0